MCLGVAAAPSACLTTVGALPDAGARMGAGHGEVRGGGRAWTLGQDEREGEAACLADMKEEEEEKEVGRRPTQEERRRVDSRRRSKREQSKKEEKRKKKSKWDP